jgi:hypothetical protein
MIIIFNYHKCLSIASRSDKNMMGLQNLCTLFGPTLMKLSPKDNLQADDMAKEIKESMQQAQVLFYILKLHEEDRLIVDQEQLASQLKGSSSTSSIVYNIGLDKNNNNLIIKNNQPQQQQQQLQLQMQKQNDKDISQHKQISKNVHTAL